MKQYIIFVLSLFISSLFLKSCESDSRYSGVPRAYGQVDNILLVCDSFVWQSPVGDTFKNYFEALYPVTPQDEPLYDVRQIIPEEFSDVKRTHRTIVILANLEAKDDAATKLVTQAISEKNVARAQSDPTYRMAIHKNRWAQGQIVIYWFAPNREELLRSISSYHNTIIQAISKHDNETLAKEIYHRGVNTVAMDTIKKLFNVDISIPKDYFIARVDNKGIWLRWETDKTSDNLFLYSLPADTKLSPDNLKLVRDTLTQEYFSSRADSSYMIIDDRFLPTIYQNTLVNNAPAMQARGIWAMVNDFMGGSFVTYLVPDPRNNRVLLLDGFTHAPGQKKRVEMRQIDMILNTLKL
jgi:Domain of unknown function (DUF4837)